MHAHKHTLCLKEHGPRSKSRPRKRVIVEERINPPPNHTPTINPKRPHPISKVEPVYAPSCLPLCATLPKRITVRRAMARNALNTVDASRNGVQSVEPNLKCKQLRIVRRLLKQLFKWFFFSSARRSYQLIGAVLTADATLSIE